MYVGNNAVPTDFIIRILIRSSSGSEKMEEISIKTIELNDFDFS